VGGTLYAASQSGTNTHYGVATTLTANTVVEIPVNVVNGNYVSYVDLDGTSADNAGIRCSGMAASRPTEVSLGNVAAGVYTITTGSYSRNNSAYIYLDDTELMQLNLKSGSWGYETTEVTVPTAGELKVVAKDGKTDYIDYVLVEKTADLAPAPSVSATPGNKAQGGTNYMTFDATPADVAAEDITDCGFAFINTATLTEAGNTIVWQKSTKRENGSFGTAIAQMAGAEDSTIYAIPFIVGNSFAKLGEAVKSVFVK
jgi:hypothetical protein